MDYNFARIGRIGNVVAGAAADDTVEERYDFVVAVVDCFLPDAACVVVVLFGNDYVHGDIAEFTGHITSVCGFQGGIRQTFTRTVRGNEVFVDAQTFTEGRENRAFDNFAVGLCHQTAGSAELANLRLVAARARVHEEVNGVYVLAAAGLDRNLRELFKRLLCDCVGRDVPNIDDLVGAFALGDCTAVVFGFDFLDLRAGLGDNARLFSGNVHVADTD